MKTEKKGQNSFWTCFVFSINTNQSRFGGQTKRRSINAAINVTSHY